MLYERAAAIRGSRPIWSRIAQSVIAAATQIGLLFGALIVARWVVESIFDWAGVGNYLVHAILSADDKVMLAATLLIGIVYTLVKS